MRKLLALVLALLLLAGCSASPSGEPSSTPAPETTPEASPQTSPPDTQTMDVTTQELRADMEAILATLQENYAYAHTIDSTLWGEYTDMLVTFFEENVFQPEGYVQIVQNIIYETIGSAAGVRVADYDVYSALDASTLKNERTDEFYAAFAYVPQETQEAAAAGESAIRTHLLMDGKAAYIAIPNFSLENKQADREALLAFYRIIASTQALILDVRGTGGDASYWSENIVSLLGQSPYVWQRNSLIRDGAMNRMFFNEFAGEDQGEFVPASKSLLAEYPQLDAERAQDMGFVRTVSEQIDPAADSVGYSGAIYVLTDAGSDAGFAAFCKESGFATLIGEQTAPLTAVGSLVPVALPGSGMVMLYAPDYLLNEDGTDSSAQGTLPDIAVENGNALEDSLLAIDPSANAQEIARSVKPMNPIVTIKMQNGDIIKAELYPDVAPNTVANFVSLIESGFYNGTIYHRVIPGFMVQGGDPDGTGMGGPGYSIKGEFTANGVTNNIKHDRGVLSMARAQHKDSAGSQFFIMVESSPHLDGQYAAFGKVIEGMEAVDNIVNQPTGSNDRPTNPPVMESVTVETGGIAYSVQKLQGIR